MWTRQYQRPIAEISNPEELPESRTTRRYRMDVVVNEAALMHWDGDGFQNNVALVAAESDDVLRAVFGAEWRGG